MRATGVDPLQAADIPPERRGRARTARLAEAERYYYLWILREFAAATPPTVEATRTAAARFGLDPDEAQAALAREDLVHTDADGRPLIAYPFSAKTRGHTVLIDGKQTVQAMCASDALGIAPMLDQPIEIVSNDPTSGAEVRVQLTAEGVATWQPAEAAVLAGSASRNGASFCGCCDVLNFFETKANATQYLFEHPEVAGAPISIPDAIEAGRIVFGDVLEEH
jgi:hypothetical protein